MRARQGYDQSWFPLQGMGFRLPPRSLPQTARVPVKECDLLFVKLFIV
jgi:hypothetical protein